LIFIGFIVCVTICSVVPCCLFIINLTRFKPPVEAQPNAKLPRVSVLIPARNEVDNIEEALIRVLTSRNVDLEVLVYDDASTDRTAELVRALAAEDPRLRLIEGITLPQGWNGKQHACWQLAQASTAPLLVFLDADVRLEPDAIARCLAQRVHTGVALQSGFPRLINKTWMEWLVLPLIQFILLGFLPMRRMRRTTIPAYAAGCGQFMLAERNTYFACGGHAAIRETRHDGLRLPKLFREHKLRTDICDLTELASVRMYSSTQEVWNGLAKNATEGLGAPAKIGPLTLLLLFGQVFPLLVAEPLILILLIVNVGTGTVSSPALAHLSWCASVAVLCSFLPRFLASMRFQQTMKSAALHPFGVLVLLAIQWYALWKKLTGKAVGWRERSYTT
jgi:cellulose synthase/poly-beta-1,6-N-acetylglucosamine synthase-like glycosyltransferase